jgi:hypothetical protein
MHSHLHKLFYNVLINSLSAQQVAYLGQNFDRSFDLHTVAGVSPSIPIPRQSAAETLVEYYEEEEDIVGLFAILLQNEGERFYNRELMIWGKEDFLNYLVKNKWTYDPSVGQFFLDPFYETEINLLKKIRVIDLCGVIDVDELVKTISAASKKMSIKDLEWRISLRLYDLDRKISELIRQIITMLLARQNLEMYAPELYACLKELAINASKANYKRLYQKHISQKIGVTAEHNYAEFLEMFRNEIEDNGNSNLLELARKDDKPINITFQSTKDVIEIWTTNNQDLSLIEKQQIMKKLGYRMSSKSDQGYDPEELMEGAGLGLNIVISALRKYSQEREPLKIVFYPGYVKIGFVLRRSELLSKIPAAAE